MDKDCEELIRDNYQNKNIEWLVKKTGYSSTSIYNFLKSENLKLNKVNKINDDVIKYILSNPDNLTQKQLAEKLNISYTTVNRIRLNNGIRIHSKHIFYI